MPGARCARSRACRVVSTRVSHHGHTEKHPAFPAQWFTAYSALSSATGLVCHRRLWRLLHKLDASVGASGPHVFAVRIMCRSSMAPSASTASRLTSVTIAKRPLRKGGTAWDMPVIWVERKQKYFCRKGWTGRIGLNCFNKFHSTRKRRPPQPAQDHTLYRITGGEFPP